MTCLSCFLVGGGELIQYDANTAKAAAVAATSASEATSTVDAKPAPVDVKWTLEGAEQPSQPPAVAGLILDDETMLATPLINTSDQDVGK